MRKALITFATVALFLVAGAVAQESRSEISLQGTGFFTKDSSGQGTTQRATNTGGFLVGYRYNLTRWLAAEADYGYDRNSQHYSPGDWRPRRSHSDIPSVPIQPLCPSGRWGAGV